MNNTKLTISLGLCFREFSIEFEVDITSNLFANEFLQQLTDVIRYSFLIKVFFTNSIPIP